MTVIDRPPPGLFAALGGLTGYGRERISACSGSSSPTRTARHGCPRRRPRGVGRRPAGDHIVWHRVQEGSTHGETAGRAGAVSVRGPLTDLLLLVYRRRPPAGLDVLGDADLLDHWLSLVKFGWPVRTATA